ncbi:MAG: proline--tRNA ligase [Candidatus Azambacteria bacterium]|nr:proline--tRNA ligase [Candidatus Azambacteria bacterium]
MLQSKAFIKTKKEAPKDEVSVNAQLLMRGGYIDKLTSGMYSFLPLGFIVLKKIERIIREEMNAIGGQEMLMPALQPKELWEEAGRWDSMDVLYKLKDQQGREFGLGPTHEEVITDIMRKRTISYKDLPLYLYQMQTKFRDELRSKSGLLRGREFIMKDMYSFHASEEDRKKYYEIAKKAYGKVFRRCGLTTIAVEASGGSFSKEVSHEFQTPTESGEDLVIHCEKCGWAKNMEVADKKAGDPCPLCGNILTEAKSIEVGNIFTLGTRFSSPMNAVFTDKDGSAKPMIMGCYGMGLSRILGTVVEVNHDDRGILWPRELAPFDVHIVPLVSKDEKITKQVFVEAEKIYHALQETMTVLYDDRDSVSAGEKFADADLIGAYQRIVISEKTLKERKIELKKRDEEKATLMTAQQGIKAVRVAAKK